jgi:hypothetical protein
MAKKEKGKLSGLKTDGTPNTYWRKFKERLEVYDNIPVSNWKDENFLGHILRRYKEVPGIVTDFALSYSGPPTKCKEIYCIRRMALTLGTEDPECIKAYLDWVFDNIIIPGKVIISSVAYFFTNSFIISFKKDYRKDNVITRASKIPDNCFNIIQQSGLELSTYGDLAFAKLAIEQDPANEDYIPYIKLFEQLKNNGLDVYNMGKLD